MKRDADALVVTVPQAAPDAYDSVVMLEVASKPDITDPPKISAEYDIFVDALEVSVTSDRENVELRYTTDGSAPTMSSQLAKGPIRLTASAVVAARCYRDGRPVSDSADAKFTKVAPRSAQRLEGLAPGVRFSYFEGDWEGLPEFATLKSAKADTLANFSLAPRRQVEHFGFEYTGYIRVSTDGVYTFFTESDDGSRLYIGDTLVVDNDRLHGMQEVKGVIALSAGLHPIKVTFFQKTGGLGLVVSYQGPGIAKQPIPDSALLRTR